MTWMKPDLETTEIFFDCGLFHRSTGNWKRGSGGDRVGSGGFIPVAVGQFKFSHVFLCATQSGFQIFVRRLSTSQHWHHLASGIEGILLLVRKMRAPLFGDAPGGERPSRGNRDSSSRHGSDSSGWLSGTATRNTALVSCAFLLMLAAMGQMGTEREWNSGLREMVRSRIEAAGLASAVRQVQTLEEISDGAAHRGERGMRLSLIHI